VSTPPHHVHEDFYVTRHRLPLVYGSAEIILCRCHCWRTNYSEWSSQDFREAIQEAVDALEDR
jgi:hypothetical protein